MMSTDNQSLLLEPGTLWDKIVARTQSALACGALQPIPTASEIIETEGVTFLVRVLANLVRKDEAKKEERQKTAASGKEFNPFLPHEEALFVADISETHLCLLNKFNVVDHHLLIITRAFEDQNQLLTVPDFDALMTCLAEFEGLGFYNGGTEAGASQRHKHLQIVPLPLSDQGTAIPIDPLMATAIFEDEIGTIPSFPFRHGIMRLSWENGGVPGICQQYDQLLTSVGLPPITPEQPGPYNLLVTREWMLIVARSQESFAGISVNSLGFAGALLVRNAEQLEVLKQHGPIQVLEQVALKW